ncbi:uncharacterized protein [Dermacentor andersoni]|uniref:uncharacterized protein isoform X11 n=1 Tax=Dermacentor andersoni TaxID=34620 RepID=UPI003B3AD08B
MTTLLAIANISAPTGVATGVTKTAVRTAVATAVAGAAAATGVPTTVAAGAEKEDVMQPQRQGQMPAQQVLRAMRKGESPGLCHE